MRVANGANARCTQSRGGVAFAGVGEPTIDASVGARCRAKREAAGVSLSDLSKRTHRSISALSRFETGKGTPHDVAELLRHYEDLEPRSGGDRRAQRHVATRMSRRIAQARVALAIFVGLKLAAWIALAPQKDDELAVGLSRIQGIISSAVLLVAIVVWMWNTNRGWALRLHLAAAGVILVGLMVRSITQFDVGAAPEAIVIYIGLDLMLVALIFQLDPRDAPWLR